MFNFSIKDSLNELKKKKYDVYINKNIDYLNNYDDYQLKSIAQHEGLKLNNLIILNFYENVGFRCKNIKQDVYGRLPLCKNIENFLNEKYSESLTNPDNIVDFLKLELINYFVDIDLEDCKICNGTGYVENNCCVDCNGTGEIRTEVNDELWKKFIDNQELGNCQSIVYFLGDLTKKYNIPVVTHFGEIEIDDPYYSLEHEETIDRFAHHWITINDIVYEFSKGTLKNYIEWDDLYSVDSEYASYHQVR